MKATIRAMARAARPTTSATCAPIQAPTSPRPVSAFPEPDEPPPGNGFTTFTLPMPPLPRPHWSRNATSPRASQRSKWNGKSRRRVCS